MFGYEGVIFVQSEDLLDDPGVKAPFGRFGQHESQRVRYQDWGVDGGGEGGGTPVFTRSEKTLI